MANAAALRPFREILGEPYCEGEDYLIYQCDCVEAMQQLPASYVNLTVTSPPYNIGKEYEVVRPLEEYLKWSSDWMAEVYRLTTPNGAFWLNVGYLEVSDYGHAVPLSYLLWDKTRFYLMQEVVWHYGAGVAARNYLSPRHERLLWYVKDADNYTFNLDDIRDPNVKYPHQKKNGKLRCNPNGKNPSDVWQIPKVTSGTNRASPERAPHPAQFPLELVERVVLGFSNEGDLVVDPFMGSGSTAEACLRNNRLVVGFEIQEHYCAYTDSRLKALQAAPSLPLGR